MKHKKGMILLILGLLQIGAALLFICHNYYEGYKAEQSVDEILEKMNSGEWNLSLFTCTVGGAYRVTIRCRRLE